MTRRWRPRFAGLAITLVTALAATVGSAVPAGAATIPVTGTAQGTAHMEWTGTFDPGECHFYGNFTLTITSGPLAGGTLHHDVCWSLPDGELNGGNLPRFACTSRRAA